MHNTYQPIRPFINAKVPKYYKVNIVISKFSETACSKFFNTSKNILRVLRSYDF